VIYTFIYPLDICGKTCYTYKKDLRIMTVFNLVSDLHLNFGDITLPGGECLIMAGDIMEAGHLRVADNAKKDVFLADRYRRFIKEELAKYNRVIYVLGNHESYSNAYEDTFERLQVEMPMHVEMLEGTSTQVNDVHIFGGTLWTDFNRSDPVTLQICEDSMNDFTAIRHKDGFKVKMAYGAEYYTNKFKPAFVKKIFHETVSKLNRFCEDHKEDKVLVVTHHAPTELSIDAMYKADYHMNGAYHSRLGEFIMDRPCIKTWVHGHVHTQNDYMMGDCRVISNPRGYKGYEQIANDFDAGFTFEL
jgi:Icc-related predicted phosphoesterase